MKKAFGATIVLALVLATPTMSKLSVVYAAGAPAAAVATAPAAGSIAVQEREEGREMHPHIRAAIHELNEAKRELQTAAHDFGGHRVEAIRACDVAIRQLQQALQYDKK